MSVFERIRRIVAHLTVALSFTFVVLVTLDYFNPLMSFLTNQFSIILLLVFCICSAFTAATRLVLTSPAIRGIEYGSPREGRDIRHGRHPFPHRRVSP